MSNSNGGEDAVETTEDNGEPTILVSEFPPPPFYYKDAETLTPPPIPQEALERGTRKAAAAAAKARAMAERERLEQTETFDKTNSILGGVKANEQEEEEEGDVVAVFGQVVEDPLLVQPIDYCEDPLVVRDEVKRLNKCVVEGFVHLVQDLVHKPLDSKKTRDEMSHNILLMLEECNKFREHQSREILIELLQDQLVQRKRLLDDLKRESDAAEKLLDD